MQGLEAKQLELLEAIREILTRDGRTLAQAELGWLLALDSQTIPIPGFKTVKQVEENVETIQFGPLTETQIQEVDQILKNYHMSL
ncbi:MAG: aldo/keto reductase [Candidatus Hodarchaeota archaeon]